ncbi:TniQ family protein [Nostoc sp. CENA67]|uniref:TniQ family protein n=1 Tax=Amazonocrinis nigriterrae CENA67 TaxID=2794033 RepID=A0A8J7HXB1_9NOST|nr:TniQ family protein [Amazonocrinis nigriterrae]MBH8566812.1 TniQ family protein [Amazonocrinis nigriterrae CENA67]
MKAEDIQPWLFRVEPYQGESLSHFLGRFRRANELTPTGLSKAAGIGGAVARWEKFRFNPPPSRQQLEALALVVGVEADRLEQMLPPVGEGMKMEPIRLCAACYAESPCHKIEWQLKVTQGCKLHQLRLLSECPNCGARFKVPALWVDGWCQRCFLAFGEMVKWQNPHLTVV